MIRGFLLFCFFSVFEFIWAGPGHDKVETGGLDFALKPKGFGQFGQFQFSIDGPAVNYFTQFLGDGFHVESSTDLKHWEEVELLKSNEKETVFQDENDSAVSRFFRVRYAGDSSTWGIIRDRIIGPNCAGCHSSGTTFAKQSQLVLTSDVAYEQLIDRKPANTYALDDGLDLVGTKGLASVGKSFLWEKINASEQQHFYDDHPGYGSLMPLGMDPLTEGELKFILHWILEGAPKFGTVARVDDLSNVKRYSPPPFKPLAKPDSGIQLHVEPFEVPSNFEREFFIYKNLNNEAPVYVNRVQIEMRPGSHHFIGYLLDSSQPLFSLAKRLFVPNKIRDLHLPSGQDDPLVLASMAYHDFFAGTQTPRYDYEFPKGVALRLPANTGLDMNTHYVNRSNEPFEGEVYMNIHTVDKDDVKYEAKIINMNNTDIELPPNKVTTMTKDFLADEKMNIFQLFSHSHEKTIEFRVEIAGGKRDGELLYVSYDWEHPPVMKFDPPLVVERGETIRLKTTYNNWTDESVSFGLRSTDEMMILFGAYYSD
ncbi:MAG: hypothetical protein ACJZ70_06800 [Limisphaerales bacterium]